MIIFYLYFLIQYFIELFSFKFVNIVIICTMNKNLFDYVYRIYEKQHITVNH